MQRTNDMIYGRFLSKYGNERFYDKLTSLLQGGSEQIQSVRSEIVNTTRILNTIHQQYLSGAPASAIMESFDMETPELEKLGKSVQALHWWIPVVTSNSRNLGKTF